MAGPSLWHASPTHRQHTGAIGGSVAGAPPAFPIHTIVFQTPSRHTARGPSTLRTDTMHARRLFYGLMLIVMLLSTASGRDAEAADTGTVMKGNAGQGQALFNGKGICHYCHGVDGVLDKKPSLKPDTAAAIAKLSAGAPDLRNRAGLTLKDNKARFRAIREGHPGSGMLPDTTLSDQDITDLLAYLASLRQSQTTPGKSPY